MSSEQADNLQAPSFRSGTPEYIKKHADELSVVPDGWIHPSEDLEDDVFDATFAILKNLADRGAARTRTVDDSDDDSDSGDWDCHREYLITESTRELVSSVVENRDAMLPCGHSGLHNHGDHFVCSFDLCSREFQREDVDV